ncbi:DUF1963 domain-containing protein [Streptomyces justiciae]|uniref:DUF1963 domain-containing protein n=1 Tax=Streptomyces justiciae TaxID=2780140 RepID=UPI00187DFAAD|nr:YwqG family protein [Streptomyces justiciae]MBE8475946.1 DUF1963 domain-containing protein [Streptomyces justiciae]
MSDGPYSRLADEHLPGDLAQRWTSLLRPCVRLRRADAGGHVAAVLGGSPHLPVGAAWPEWPEHGPLAFIASVRCAALPREGLGDEFPRDGTLLFFHFDGQPHADTVVCIDDPETWAGAQVLYVPENTPVLPADTPSALEPYPRVELTADSEQSAPDLWLPQARRALLGDTRAWPRHRRDLPAQLTAFVRAFARLRTRVEHQISGHACPVQGPVEYDVANATLAERHEWGDPPLDDEAERWVLLAQFAGDHDADMMWGDEGTLYWLIRADDLAARKFDQVRLVIQT